MDLRHEKMSQDEAAKKLKVKINGIGWNTERIAIVRREKGGSHWVQMKVVDPASGMQYEYFMKRLPMIKAWLALEDGNLTNQHLKELRLFLNGNPCKITDVNTIISGDETWVQMNVLSTQNKQTIAIERQSMINAYYALRLSVEDMFETAMEVVEGIFEL